MSDAIYEVDNICFRYPGYERDVLKRVSLSLHKGEILCILGPNGAGKTTLLSCMAGLLRPASGTIRLCGRELSGMSEKEIAKLTGFVPQMHIPSFDYRVIDFVLMGRAPHTGLFSRPTAEEEQMCRTVLENMGLGHIAEKSYLDISGGERQQLLIARAVIQSPEAILFDEPTAHLDLEAITALNNGLTAFQGPIIFCSQDHEFVQTVANRVLELTPDGVLDRSITFDEWLETKKKKK